MKRILIIEDDPFIADTYASTYVTRGFVTAIASDGEEGLSLLDTFKPDLIHLDLSLPKLDGAEVIRQIRSRPDLEFLPIVVVTNTYQNRLVKAAIEAGATKLVSKATCTPRMMVDIVERLRTRRIAEGSPPETVVAAAPRPPQFVVAAPAVVPAAAVPAPAGLSLPAIPPDLLAPSNPRKKAARHVFDAANQNDFKQRGPQLLACLRERIEPLLRAQTDDLRAPELTELFNSADTLASHAGMAGFQEVSQMSLALAALLKELSDNPKALTNSSLRTIVDACDRLTGLFENLTDSAPVAGAPAMVLVVDAEALSRQAVCLALTRLHVATLSVDDPETALRLLADNHFSLILLEVELPWRSGFDVCKELRTLPAHQTTPVVFVSSREDDETRARSQSSGGSDLIAKPFLPMELAVKALSLLR